MNLLKNAQYLLCFALLFSAVSSFSQEKDKTTAEILEILKLLQEDEQKEIVIVARSQKDTPPEIELEWLLSNLDQEAKDRVLAYIERKAGSRLKKKGAADVHWLQSVYNFGVTPEGKVVTFNFEFENIGDVPYLISNVEASCGCTIAEYPKEPIPPGGKGMIKAKFHSIGKVGDNTEFITVVGNSHPEHVALIIEGKVYKP
jgi:hypothetical protein